MNCKIIFRPICIFQEIYRTFVYRSLISGHDYIEQADGSFICELCGKTVEN